MDYRCFPDSVRFSGDKGESSMVRNNLRVSVFLASVAAIIIAFPVASAAQTDPQELFDQLEKPVFTRTATVENTGLKRDAIELTFLSGQLTLADAISSGGESPGRVFSGAFKGRGRLRLRPALRVEIQQLKLHTGGEELEVEFTEAVLFFTDATAEELGKDLKFAEQDTRSLAELYENRRKFLRRDGLNWEPRMLKSLLAADPAPYALLVADLNTKKHGWLTAIFDAADPEQIEIVKYNRGRFARNIWTKFPAEGRTPEEAFADPLAHHDYRIQSYVLDVTVDKKTKVHGKAEVSIDIKRAGQRILLFQLDANLRVSSVSDPENATVSFLQVREPGDRGIANSYLLVISEDPFTTDPHKLKFEYEGGKVVRNVGNGNFFARSFGWYPTYGSGRFSITTNWFAGKSDFDLTLRIPKRYIAVAVGSKTEDVIEGGYRVTRWISDIPLKVAGFAYGDYVLESRAVGDVRIDIYANKNPDNVLRSVERAASGGQNTSAFGQQGNRAALGSLAPAALRKTMAKEIVKSLAVMENYFGPYPYKKLAVTNISGSFGQGWPGLLYLSTLTFLDSTQRNAIGIRDHTRLTAFFRAHETSHQWWGHVVGWKSYHDQWLSEGFAEFSGNLYAMFRKKPGEYLRLFRNSRDNLLTTDRGGKKYDTIGPIYAGLRLSSGKHPGAYNVLVYEKGGWVLHMLRMMLYDTQNPQQADARFIAMMKDFTSTHYNDAASTEDFKRIVEKHMLPEMNIDGDGTMDWFFDAYVYGTGIPKIKFDYTLEPAPQDGQWILKGKITASRVGPTFRTILPLYFHQGGGSMRAGWLTAWGPETPFETVLPFKPDKVTLNDMEEILAEIE